MKRISVDNGNSYYTGGAEACLCHDDKLWEAIEFAMDDQVRERVHNQHAPCSRADFLNYYLAEAEEDLVIG